MMSYPCDDCGGLPCACASIDGLVNAATAGATRTPIDRHAAEVAAITARAEAAERALGDAQSQIGGLDLELASALADLAAAEADVAVVRKWGVARADEAEAKRDDTIAPAEWRARVARRNAKQDAVEALADRLAGAK